MITCEHMIKGVTNDCKNKQQDELYTAKGTKGHINSLKKYMRHAQKEMKVDITTGKTYRRKCIA